MLKNFLVQLRVEGHQNLYSENMSLYGIGIVIYFCEVFQCYAFHQCHNIWMKQAFQGHYHFLG